MLELGSHRIVGYAMESHVRTELVATTLTIVVVVAAATSTRYFFTRQRRHSSLDYVSPVEFKLSIKVEKAA